MSNLEDIEWLWEKSLTSDQRDRLVSSVANSGDIDAVEWLWEKSLTSDQRDRLVSSVANSGDIDAIEWLWEKSLTSDQRDRLVASVASSEDKKAVKWLWEKSLTSAQRDKLVSGVTAPVRNEKKVVKTSEPLSNHGKFKFDVFISHASEDKATFVRQLARALVNEGLKVWYDEFTLKLGDSLRRSIDNGLANSRYGIVVLSLAFFEKEWPQKELDGLVALEDGRDKVILPIWHGVDKEYVKRYSPMLADRRAVSSSEGMKVVVKEIVSVVKESQQIKEMLT